MAILLPRPGRLRKVLYGVLVLVTLVLMAPFAGAMFSGALLLLLPPLASRADHDLSASYQPRHKGHIHLGTGLYIREDEDLVVGGTPALILRRTYLSGYRVSREFGIGTTHNGELYLVGDPDRFQWAALVLPDGAQVRFERVSMGTSFYNAMYEHRSTPSRWQGARLGWIGSSWVLRRRDGARFIFQGCGEHDHRVCSILQESDEHGHTIFYQRDARRRLVKMLAAADRWIAFEYDAHDRIIRASDPAHHAVRYEYDAAGRLIRVTSSDGREHRYDYTDRDELARIVDPGTTIENAYDTDGRCIRQVNHHPDDPEPFTFEFAYQVRNDAVVQADTRRSDGSWTRYTYGAGRYIASEAWGNASEQAADVSYERDPVTQIVTALTLTCPDRRGVQRSYSRSVPDGYDEWVKSELLRTKCWWPDEHAELTASSD